ncbi:hypothetical protein CBS101457_000951 [Exobasidium rhododendri]|nr:hypothetical protein CBS101457_000951 [Exobasidium rhododendri]
MGCCGEARWKREEVPDHKFDFIDVRDYWSNGYLVRIKYAFLYLNIIKSFAVYVADIYTAITLLAFHHFNGSIYDRVEDSVNTVSVPFVYGKWIFTGCIIFSFLLLAYEAHKGRAVVRSRDISYAYTNVMANNYYSLRSYNHFCFFSQLNNSKKKKDELAFFIFFTFKGWKRLLVADGPRQVINALTLYALAEVSDFSTNISAYYEGNIFTAIMLLTMLFTVVIFAGSFILLSIATLMYLPLICYIKGNLKEYCCHKIDKRISELVQKKKKQRLGKYAAIARAEAAGDFSHLMNKKGVIVGRKMLQPTLPQLDINLMEDDSKMIKKKLDRKGSVSSSTVHGGYYGTEKSLYGMKDGEDYGSTAQLVLNQGHAGSNVGHLYSNGNGSISSATLNVNPSLPPTVYNSPESYPMQVRGMQGVQDVLRTQGSFNNSTILAQMGPIGTSPDLYAKRMLGRGNTMLSTGEEGRDREGATSPAMSAYRGVGVVKSPLAVREETVEDLQEGSYFDQQQNQRSGGAHRASSNTALDLSQTSQAIGVKGEEFRPASTNMSLREPTDLSAYTPYHQSGSPNDLSPYPEGSQQLSRVHSFSEVYEAYYEEHDGQEVYPLQDELPGANGQQSQYYQGYNQGPQAEYLPSHDVQQADNSHTATANGAIDYAHQQPTSHHYNASQAVYQVEEGEREVHRDQYYQHQHQHQHQHQQTEYLHLQSSVQGGQYVYQESQNEQMYNNYQVR